MDICACSRGELSANAAIRQRLAAETHRRAEVPCVACLALCALALVLADQAVRHATEIAALHNSRRPRLTGQRTIYSYQSMSRQGVIRAAVNSSALHSAGLRNSELPCQATGVRLPHYRWRGLAWLRAEV